MDPQHIRNRKQKTTIAEMDSDTVPQQFPGAIIGSSLLCRNIYLGIKQGNGRPPLSARKVFIRFYN